ncbi:MAG TPA: TetR/AcrR family transcriptional regulator [Ramlibacter sp.]|nr:TetR/AcrR family transcriptional regulator [Ramlibacter sp.]
MGAVRAGTNASKSGQVATEAANEPPRLQEVLDVAGKLFREKGYRSTSLVHIAEALGMNKASLYYYVESKEELARKLILRASRRLRDVSRGADIAALPAEQALERLVREHADVILAHPNEIALLIEQRRFVEPTALGDLAERERAYVASLRTIIARGIEDGSFRRVDAGVATQLVLDTINGLLRWYRPGGRLSAQRAVDEIWTYIHGGLCESRARARRVDSA